MNEQLSPHVAQVDALLRRASRALVYPSTPSMAAAVIERTGREQPAAGAWLGVLLQRWWARPLVRVAAAALAAAVVAAGAAAAVPQSRSALADFFGLSHVRVEVGPPLGPEPPVLSPDSFARPSSVRAAQDAVDFPLRFPTQNGRQLFPDAVYLQGESASARVVIFVYDQEGFDLYQSRAGIFGKGGPDPGTFHEIDFDGRPALWIDGGGHIASFLDAQGRVVVESQRTVERATLLWEQSEITYRLETSLSQDEAIQIARSLR